MAANKRPRKKYSPKRNPLAACRYAHFVPKLAVSNEPLKDEEITGISAPYFAFIEALKAGTATVNMFYAACSTHYLYFALLKVFQADTFNADEDTEAALEMAAWKHYVRAIKESEPILDAEAHRKRKKQKG